MSDRDLPELPSDEELGMDRMDLDELAKLLAEEQAPRRPPPPGGRAPGDGPPGRRPRGTWSAALATVIVLLVGAWASSSQRALPSTVPANAPETEFASGRAMAQLVEVARAPRPVGSPEHTRVRELLVERLEQMGLEPQVQTSLSVRRQGQDVRAVTLRNIVARIPGSSSTGTILLTAHYDAVPLSVGAGDDATGVAAILEAVRALRAGRPLENDVIVLLTDGEEIGLLGARAFVEEHPWMDDVSLVISVEMRGGGGPVHMFETGPDNGWIVRAMQESDPRPLAMSLSVEIYRQLPQDTDFTPFRDVGIQGLNFAAIDRAWVYHQPTDVPANLQEETIQHHGMRILAIVRDLGGRDLSEVHQPDLVYSTLPILGIVAYPLGWTLPVSAGVFLLWIGATMLAIGRGGRGRGALLGLGVALAAGAAAWGLGWAMMAWLPRFHPEYQSLTPAFYGEGWYVLGLVAATLAVTTALVALGRRWASVAALGAGALLPAAVGVLVLAFMAPLTAMELQGPALAGVLAVGVAAVGGGAVREGRLAGWARVIVLLLALPVLPFMVPLFEGVWVSMSFRLAAILGALVVLALTCLLPALEGLGEPNRWWAPAAAAVAAILFTGAGILQAGPSADRPVHSTLLYVLDRAEGEAVWATREDPGLEWAASGVGPFTGERSLGPFLIPALYRTAPADVFDIPAPTAALEGTVPGGVPGVFRVRVTSEAGAELVSILLAEEVEGTLVAVNGQRFPAAEPGSVGARRPVTRVTHQGVPQGVLNVDIEVPEGTTSVPLTIVEHHLRPAEYVGEAPFRRPAHLMASPIGWSDRAVIRTPVTVRVAPLVGSSGDGGWAGSRNLSGLP